MDTTDIFTMLRNLPLGSLLWVDYVPTVSPENTAAQRRAVAARKEAAMKSRMAGIPTTHYMVELAGVRTSARGHEYFFGKCLNRDRQFRSFNPSKGTLRAIQVLREGPETGSEVAA